MTSASNDESMASACSARLVLLFLLLLFSGVMSPEDDDEDDRVASCMSSNLFGAKSLLLLTVSISDPIGTKVRARYFVPPSSPESLLWL